MKQLLKIGLNKHSVPIGIMKKNLKKKHSCLTSLPSSEAIGQWTPFFNSIGIDTDVLQDYYQQRLGKKIIDESLKPTFSDLYKNCQKVRKYQTLRFLTYSHLPPCINKPWQLHFLSGEKTLTDKNTSIQNNLSSLDFPIDDQEKKTAILYLLLSGQVDVIKAIIKEHQESATKGLDLAWDWLFVQTNLLHAAAFSGTVEAIKLIDDTFPDLACKKDDRDRNVLHYATLSGSVKAIQYILNRHPHLAKENNDCDANVLHYAGLSGSVSAIELILTRMPDLVNTANNSGLNVLHFAAQSGSVTAITFILKKHPYLAGSKCKHHSIVLDHAAYSGSVEAIKFIFENFPDLAKRYRGRGQNFVHYATMSGSVTAVSYILEMFPKSAKIKTSNGRNCMHLAAYTGSVAVMKFLSNKHPELAEIKFHNRRNTLHEAISSGSVSAVEFILNKFAHLAEHKNSNGHNALHYAASKNSVKMIQCILKKRPELTLSVDNYGRNIVFTANASKAYEAKKYLEEKCGYIATKGINLFKKSHPHAYRDYQLTRYRLHYAANSGSMALFKLINHNYSKLATSKDEFGRNALHYAAMSGSLDIVKCILKQHQQIVDSKDNKGLNILHHAASKPGSLNMIKYILDTYPYLATTKDNAGKNVLHFAAQSQQLETIKFILHKHSELALTKDKNGRNILHFIASASPSCSATHHFRQLLIQYPEITASCWVKEKSGMSVDSIAQTIAPTEILNTLLQESLSSLLSNTASADQKSWALKFLQAYNKKLFSFLLYQDHTIKLDDIVTLIEKNKTATSFLPCLTNLKPLLQLNCIKTQDQPLTIDLLRKLNTALRACKGGFQPHGGLRFYKLKLVETFECVYNKLSRDNNGSLKEAIQTLSIIVDDYQRNLTESRYDVETILLTKLLSSSTLATLRAKTLNRSPVSSGQMRELELTEINNASLSQTLLRQGAKSIYKLTDGTQKTEEFGTYFPWNAGRQ